MRKLVLIVILFIMLFTAIGHSEEVIVNTPEGEKIIIVPEKYDELREAYIEMSLLYISESQGHEETINNVFKLLDIIEEYKDIIDEYKEVIELQKEKSFYKSAVVLGTDVYFPIYNDWDVQLKLGYRGILFDKLMFDVTLNYPPIGIGVVFGWKF